MVSKASSLPVMLITKPLTGWLSRNLVLVGVMGPLKRVPPCNDQGVDLVCNV